jgi:hypothetical protein
MAELTSLYRKTSAVLSTPNLKSRSFFLSRTEVNG